MPVYQYLCPKCNLKFDLKQSFSDESIVTCPKCQNGARRLFSPVPVIFKGSGFYSTDNRKSKSESTGTVSKISKTEDKGATKETPQPAV
ncbi:MAG: FmdB family transcriptional regulator [Dehalococcoidia bacterium]|nr:FmdB family transcriptional regulator [Dehalococcoidia bacterium]